MKTTILIILLLAGVQMNSYAQQALWGGEEIISPEVHQDGTVTFRIQAPEASTVRLLGDWMPSEGWSPGFMEMEKEEEGLWTVTAGPLVSDLYTYFFMVDGVRVLDPANVHVVRDVASLFNIVAVGEGAGDYYMPGDLPRGTVARMWYNSPSLEKERRITVYTPPGYEESEEEYPVLYLLHGMGGDEEAWITLGRTAQIMDRLIAEGKAVPMIVVMPNGNVAQQAAPGHSREGLTRPVMMLPNTMDGVYERSFGDIVEFVENRYRVIREKSSRAIAGLSMGGFHSLHISRTYPDTFGYVGLFSPAIFPMEGTTAEIYEDLEGSLQRQKEASVTHYRIAIGKEDFLYGQVEEFRELLDSIELNYEYIETEGGHTWKNWRDYLRDFVPELFR